MSRPATPRGLTREEKETFNRVVDHLERFGQVTAIDSGVIRRYVELRTEWKTLRGFIRKNGHVVKTTSREGAVRTSRRPESGLDPSISFPTLKKWFSISRFPYSYSPPMLAINSASGCPNFPFSDGWASSWESCPTGVVP